MAGPALDSEETLQPVLLLCDGCGKQTVSTALLPVGDGTLNVCPACFPSAIATVNTPAPTPAPTPAN